MYSLCPLVRIVNNIVRVLWYRVKMWDYYKNVRWHIFYIYAIVLVFIEDWLYIRSCLSIRRVLLLCGVSWPVSRPEQIILLLGCIASTLHNTNPGERTNLPSRFAFNDQVSNSGQQCSPYVHVVRCISCSGLHIHQIRHTEPSFFRLLYCNGIRS